MIFFSLKIHFSQQFRILALRCYKYFLNLKINMVNTSKLKSIVMPIALVVGIFLGLTIPKAVIVANAAIPYLIGLMLLFTYSKLNFRELSIFPMPLVLILIQVGASIIAYLALYRWNPLFAQQAFICLLCPVATSAPVTTNILGGNTASIVSYTLLCYFVIALVFPLLLPLAGGVGEETFLSTSLVIAKQIMPLIFLPLIVAVFVRKISYKFNFFLVNGQDIAFYLWGLTLTLVIGKATTYVAQQPSNLIPMEIGLALIALVACLLQFAIGREVGLHYKDAIAATQGLGQKNIALAMWIGFTYLNPLVSVGLAAYSIWQNIINSAQIYHKTK